MTDPEKRIADLEARCLRLEAAHLYQNVSIATLLAIIARQSAALQGGQFVPESEVRRIYAKKLREETGKMLAGISDESPALATALRAILAQELDAKPDQKA